MELIAKEDAARVLSAIRKEHQNLGRFITDGPAKLAHLELGVKIADAVRVLIDGEGAQTLGGERG